MNPQLSESTITALRNSLLNERQRLQVSESDAVYTGNNRLEIKVDAADNADETSDAALVETEVALEDHILESVAQINRALKRIEHGQYGTCQDCAKPIPLARLQAFPAALRCLPCKQVYEDR